MPNPAQFGNLITSAVETPTDCTRRRSKRCVVFLCLAVNGHSGPPLYGDAIPTSASALDIDKPINAQRGGMLSGRAASRIGQLSDTASQHTSGGWQGGHHPRWQYIYPRLEIMTLAIRDGRPT